MESYLLSLPNISLSSVLLLRLRSASFLLLPLSPSYQTERGGKKNSRDLPSVKGKDKEAPYTLQSYLGACILGHSPTSIPSTPLHSSLSISLCPSIYIYLPCSSTLSTGLSRVCHERDKKEVSGVVGCVSDALLSLRRMPKRMQSLKERREKKKNGQRKLFACVLQMCLCT